MTSTRDRRRLPRRGDRGMVGGVEVLPFGFLVFVSFTMLIVSVWAVIDTRFATDAAATEAVRLVVESAHQHVDENDLRSAAAQHAIATFHGHGRAGTPDVHITSSTGTLERCAVVTATVTHSVPAVRIPFVGGFGSPITVRSSHSALVDPTRSGVGGEATCLG